MKFVKHINHECVVFREEVGENTETQQHSSCKGCGKFFTGKLQSGIECKTCNDLFHKECFALIKDDDDYEKNEEEFDDPEDLLIIQTESIDEFYLGEMDRNTAKKKLKRKRRGTF